MELKDLVKYDVPMRMEGSSPPNWEVIFGYDISKFKGYNVDEVRVALNLTQLWLSQGPREQDHTAQRHTARQQTLSGSSHCAELFQCVLIHRSLCLHGFHVCLFPWGAMFPNQPHIYVYLSFINWVWSRQPKSCKYRIRRPIQCVACNLRPQLYAVLPLSCPQDQRFVPVPASFVYPLPTKDRIVSKTQSRRGKQANKQAEKGEVQTFW